jgi:hypothetical protein
MKRTITIFVCFLAVLALAACGNDNESPIRTGGYNADNYLKGDFEEMMEPRI